jgi:hypothetical protein
MRHRLLCIASFRGSAATPYLGNLGLSAPTIRFVTYRTVLFDMDVYDYPIGNSYFEGTVMNATQEYEVRLFDGECIAQGCRGRRSDLPINKTATRHVAAT